jgi:hypothetical protein
MGRKDFQKGMEAGAKPFEDKFKQQAKAINRVSDKLEAGIKKIDGVVEEVIDGLSSIQKKELYDLNTQFDIKNLEDYEKELLLAGLFIFVKESANENQQAYIRSVKKYLEITAPQTQIDLASIENIENLVTQKAMFQVFIEFLFLKNENDSFFDEYSYLFDHFSVNKKDKVSLFNNVLEIYRATGIQGICEKYGYVAYDEKGKIISDDEKLIIPDRIEKILKIDSPSFFINDGRAAISSDGKYLAMIIQEDNEPYDAFLKIMDTESDKILHDINWNEWFEEYYKILAVSPNGNFILFDGYPKYIYDIENNKMLESNDVDCPVSFSWDNKKIAFRFSEWNNSLQCGINKLKVVDTHSWDLLFSINDSENNFISDFTFSPDNCYLVSYARGGINFWDANNGNEHFTLTTENDRNIDDLAFSHDGKYIVIANSKKLIIKDTKNGNILKQFEYKSGISKVCYNHNSKIIAVLFNNNIFKFIDSETGERLQTLPVGKIEWMSFSKNGKKFITYGAGKIKFWIGE